MADYFAHIYHGAIMMKTRLEKIFASFNNLAGNDKAAYLCIVIFIVFLVSYGFLFHKLPDELPSNPEVDGYLLQATSIGHGLIPAMDVFHPLGYSALVAVPGFLVNDYVLGGVIISALSAGLFLLYIYLTGKKIFNSQVGLGATILCMLSFTVMQAGIRTASDMTFAACCMAVIYYTLKIQDNTEYKNFVVLGVFTAIAYVTRYNALLLLPIILVSLVITAKKHGLLVKQWVTFMAVLSMFVLPQLLITYFQYGSPFYNEAWRNIALVIFGGLHDNAWGYATSVTFSEFINSMARYPGLAFGHFIGNLVQFFGMSWELLMGNNALYHIPYDRYVRYLYFAAILWPMAIMSIAGIYTAIKNKTINRNYLTLILLYLTIYIVVFSFCFTVEERLMMPILGVTNIFLIYLVFGLFKGSARYQTIVVLYVFIPLLVTGAVALYDYAGMDPVTDLKIAQTLENRNNDSITIAGTATFLQPYLSCNYTRIPYATGAEVDSPQLYNRMLKNFLDNGHYDYLIVGRSGYSYPGLSDPRNNIYPYLKYDGTDSTENVIVYTIDPRAAYG